MCGTCKHVPGSRLFRFTFVRRSLTHSRPGPGGFRQFTFDNFVRRSLTHSRPGPGGFRQLTFDNIFLSALASPVARFLSTNSVEVART